MGLLRRRLMIKEALKRESDKVAKLPLNDSLVDAWVFSGYENADAPTSIVGVNGNKLACHNFAWNETGSGFMDGALWFDGVVDYLMGQNLETLSSYTVIAKFTSYSEYTSTYKRFFQKGAFVLYDSYKDMILSNYGSDTVVGEYKHDGVLYFTDETFMGSPISKGTSSDTSSLYIGAGSNRDNAEMSIKYFALYDRTLTEQEIKEEIIKLEYRWNLRKKMADNGYVGVLKTNMEFVPYDTVIQGGIDKSEVVGLTTKIAVGGTSRIILVSPDGPLQGPFSNKAIILPDGVNAYDQFATAMEVDQDGEVNTQAFAPLLTGQPDSVVNQCLNYTFKNGQHGYLMSLPDSVKLFAYNEGLTRLNNMLGAIGGGELIDSRKAYFTSSVSSIKDDGIINMIWFASFDGTTANINYYHKSYYVIPIAKLNI